jgi:subtilisin family serine protease
VENIGVYQLRWTTPGDLTQMTTTLEGIGGVAAVEPSALLGDLNLSVSPPGDWKDDRTAVTWPFTQLRLQDAWSTTTGGNRAVGILENDAVLKDHEDLNVTSVLGPGVVKASEPHATHVAGLACAKANGKGVVGAAWGCPVVSGTFALSGDSDKQTVANVLQGATDLAASGVGVINMSIGDNYFKGNEHCIDKASSDAMQQTEQSLSAGFRRLFNSPAGRDIVWTLSAGNNCASGVTSTWGVSWALPNVITVAATNSDKTLASFSNFGPGVEVAAPGGIGIGIAGGANGLWSTTATKCGWFNGSLCSFYGTMSGTSMSAPLVAGIAELAESAAPTASAAEIGSCIVATAGTATGNVTQRSTVPSSLGNTTFTPSPSIPFDGTTNPIPIVDAAAAVSCAQTGQAKADVLVTGLGDRTSSGNGTDRGDLFAALTAHGFTVQVSDALPPDLSKYGQVWYIDTEALSTDDTTLLETYVQSGGSAYLTGERPCCTDSDTVTALINALTSDTVGYGGELFNNHFVISRNPYGITSSPNAIAYLDQEAPGSLTGVSDPHIVADDGSGLTVWAAYGPVDVKGGGKLVAVMDINYLAEQYRSANWGDIVDNIAHFLGKPSGALGAGKHADMMDAPRQSSQRITPRRDPRSTTG